MDILSGLENYLQCNKIKNINDIIGTFNG
jgi:hypothetical protein